MNYIFDHSLQRDRARSPEPIEGADEPLRKGRAANQAVARTAAEQESIGVYGLPRSISVASSSSLDLDEAHDNLQSGNPLHQLKTLQGLHKHGLLSDAVVADKQRELLDRVLVGGYAAPQDPLQPCPNGRLPQQAVEEGDPPIHQNGDAPSDSAVDMSSSPRAIGEVRTAADHNAPPRWFAPAPADFGRHSLLEQDVYDRNDDGGAMRRIIGGGGPSPAAEHYSSRLLRYEPELQPKRRPRAEPHTSDTLSDSFEGRALPVAESAGRQNFGRLPISPKKKDQQGRDNSWHTDASADGSAGSHRRDNPTNSPTNDLKRPDLGSSVEDSVSDTQLPHGNMTTATTVDNGATGMATGTHVGARPGGSHPLSLSSHGSEHSTTGSSSRHHPGDRKRASRQHRADDDISPKPSDVPAEVIIAHLDSATDDARLVAQLLDARQGQWSPLGSN